MISTLLIAATATLSYGAKMNDWDFTILGHRGGSSGFIPEHSIMSFTIGAQNGASYLEPDIVFTSDEVQIIRHHPDLAEATNVDEVYGTNSSLYTENNTIEYFWRTEDEGGPSTHPFREIDGGYFSWDFTFAQTQTLSLISDDFHPSPFDDMDMKVMTLESLLILIRDSLMPTLKRPIGLIPEIKYPHEYETRLGKDIELLHLQLLEQYGYLTYDAQSDYYSVKTMCDFAKDVAGLTECDAVYADQPCLILQSFNAPSLDAFKELTDAPLIYLGYYKYDLMDEDFVKWVKTDKGYDGLGLNTVGLPALKQSMDAMKAKNESVSFDNFKIFAYTLDADVSAYFEIISNSTFVDGIFTDESDTARVIQQTLDYVKENDFFEVEHDHDDESSAFLAQSCNIFFALLFFIFSIY